MQILTDVWKLETEEEDIASLELNLICEEALGGDRKAQNCLKSLWEESWQSIKAKLLTEGSLWCVWWMDGVRKYLTTR